MLGGDQERGRMVLDHLQQNHWGRWCKEYALSPESGWLDLVSVPGVCICIRDCSPSQSKGRCGRE